MGGVQAPDRDLTEVLPRHAGDTGQIPAAWPAGLPAAACPFLCRSAACRHAVTAAWVLVYVTLTMWAYVDARIVLLLWEWR